MTEVETLVGELISCPEYCIVSYLLDEYRNELTLYVSEFNEAQLEIPESINGIKIELLRLID